MGRYRRMNSMGELLSNYEKGLLEKTDRAIRGGKRPDSDESERGDYVWVKGYYKEDGTRVKGHYRRIDGAVEVPLGAPGKRLGLFEKAKIRRENIAKRRQEDQQIYVHEFRKHKTTAIKEKARRDAMGSSLSTGEKINRIFKNIINSIMFKRICNMLL